MFKVGDIVEITEESSATGMLDFIDGKGYAVEDVGCDLKWLHEDSTGFVKRIPYITLKDESGRAGRYKPVHFKLKETKEEAKVEKKECLFKKGQTVWDLRNGRGVVEEIIDDEPYSVKVKFDLKDCGGGQIFGCYTVDGRYTETQTIRSLYFSEPKIEAATEPLFEPILEAGMTLGAVDKETSRFCSVIVREETEEDIESVHGVVFEKTLHDFYRLGEKIKFN